MKAEQVLKIVDHVIATYNLSPNQTQKGAMNEAWQRFVGDLDYDAVMEALDYQALSSSWAPKPADTRVLVVAPGMPTADEAWSDCKKVLEFVNYGAGSYEEASNVHPIVSNTMNAIKYGLNERSFKAEYETQRARFLHEQFKETHG